MRLISASHELMQLHGFEDNYTLLLLLLLLLGFHARLTAMTTVFRVFEVPTHPVTNMPFSVDVGCEPVE